MNKTEALSELSMALGDLESLAEACEDDRADNYSTSEALEVLAEALEPQTFAVDFAALTATVAFWDRIAEEHGWEVKSMTVWVRADGSIEDSVGISEGTGLFLVPSGKA